MYNLYNSLYHSNLFNTHHRNNMESNIHNSHSVCHNNQLYTRPNNLSSHRSNSFLWCCSHNRHNRRRNLDNHANGFVYSHRIYLPSNFNNPDSSNVASTTWTTTPSLATTWPIPAVQTWSSKAPVAPNVPTTPSQPSSNSPVLFVSEGKKLPVNEVLLLTSIIFGVLFNV